MFLRIGGLRVLRPVPEREKLILSRFCRGEGWQRLRREDFSQVDLEANSPELVELIRNMMRTDPGKRLTMAQVCAHPVVRRAREKMEALHEELKGSSTWGASPLASVGSGFLDEILGTMDVDG